jgi:hypothetical protein
MNDRSSQNQIQDLVIQRSRFKVEGLAWHMMKLQIWDAIIMDCQRVEQTAVGRHHQDLGVTFVLHMFPGG